MTHPRLVQKSCLFGPGEIYNHKTAQPHIEGCGCSCGRAGNRRSLAPTPSLGGNLEAKSTSDGFGISSRIPRFGTECPKVKIQYTTLVQIAAMPICPISVNPSLTPKLL